MFSPAENGQEEVGKSKTSHRGIATLQQQEFISHGHCPNKKKAKVKIKERVSNVSGAIIS